MKLKSFCIFYHWDCNESLNTKISIYSVSILETFLSQIFEKILLRILILSLKLIRAVSEHRNESAKILKNKRGPKM